MYGDPDVLRSRVDDLREQAVDVRAMADHLVSKTDDLGWSGRAADAMRRRVAERAGHLRAAAAEHDTAADSLLTHAQEVETLQESIAGIERRFARLVADARARAGSGDDTGDDISDGAGRGSDDADRGLLSVEPPPPGHRDWLDLEVAGL